MFNVTDAITNLDDDYFTNGDTLGSDPKPEDVEFNADAIEGAFSRYNPTTSKFWDNVWEEVNLNDAKPVYQDHLPGALRFCISFRESRAIDAVRVGMAAGHLIPFGENALRRPGPRDTPDEYLSAEEKETFQRRATWKELWDAMGAGEEAGAGPNMVITAVQATHEVSAKKAKAAIGAGATVDVIIENADKLALGDRRLPVFWQQTLAQLGIDPGANVANSMLRMALSVSHSLSDEAITATIEQAATDKVLYQPAEHDKWIINSPRSESGPDVADAAFSPDRYPVIPSGTNDKSDSDSGDDDDDDDDNDDNAGGSATDTHQQNAPVNDSQTESTSTDTTGDNSSSNTTSTVTDDIPVPTGDLVTNQTAPTLLAGAIGTAIADSLSGPLQETLRSELTEPLSSQLTTSLTHAIPDAHTNAVTTALNDALAEPLHDMVTDADVEEITQAYTDTLVETNSEELRTVLTEADDEILATALPTRLVTPLAESLATQVSTELPSVLPESAQDELATVDSPALTDPLADSLATALSDKMPTEHSDADLEAVATAIAIAATTQAISVECSRQIRDHQSQIHDALPDAVIDMLATPSVKDVVTTVAQQTTPDTHAQLKDDLWSAMFDAGPLVSLPLQQLSERAAVIDAGGVQTTTTENGTDASQSAGKVQTTLAGQNTADGSTQAAHDDASTADKARQTDEPTTAPNATIADVDPSDLRLSPTPSVEAVQACLEAAATFFHDHLDTVIDASVEFNKNTAPDAGYRLPETPRAYFCGPDESPPLRAVAPDAHAETGTTIEEPIDVDGDGDTDAATATTLTEMNTPYRYLGTDTRGWPTEIVEQKQLGWAPTDQTALCEYLSEQGFAYETMVATGLFSSIGQRGSHPAYGENDDGEAYMDFTTVDDADMEPLRCFFIGRYVFPYTDAEERVAFFIGRVPGYDTDAGNHPDDFAKGKYVKLASRKPYTIIDEPIYGRETVVEGAPLVVTEGIADAITAHAHGIPCISPVTTEFKTSHQSVLTEIVRENAIPTVYFLQDSDPISASVPDRETVSEQTLTRAVAIRELFLTGSFPGSDACTPEAIVTAAADGDEALDAILDDEAIMVAPPADPDADASGETRVTATEVPVRLIAAQYDVEAPPEILATGEVGPLGTAMDIQRHGPGIKGAVKTSTLLDQTTPSRSNTLTGVTEAAATLYDDRVINADEDTPPLPADPADRREVLYATLSTIASDEDADEPTESSPEETRSAPRPVRIDSAPEYSGTDVWILEMPQLAAVKRDLDDYLQEGWLGILPPMEWAIQATLGTDADPGGDTETSAWVAGLADADATTDTYPARFRPEQIQYPAVNDLANTVGTVPVGGDESPPTIYQPRRIDEPQTSQWPAATVEDLRTQNQRLTPIPEVNDVYPPLALFGLLPRIHPRNHPAAKAARKETRVSTGTDLEVDPDEIETRVEEGTDYRELTGRYNPLWNATLRDLGLTPGSRGKNPLGHYGNSENYFVVFDDELAYCHKSKALYNFVHFALCDAGVRDPHMGVEGQSLSEKEYFKLWEYAYEKNVVPEETPLPIPGLKWYAITNDFISAEDYAAHNDDDADEESNNSGLPLPATTYRRVLKDIRRQTGLEPPQLTDLLKQESTDNQHRNATEIQIDLEHLHDKYGLYAEMEKAPDFLQQFINRFIRQTDEEVTTNKEETIFEAKVDVRAAYNTLVKAIRKYDHKYDDTYPDSLEMITYSSSQFTKEMKKRLAVDVEDSRPHLSGRGQTRVWFGIEFTDEGEDLHDIVTQIED